MEVRIRQEMLADHQEVYRLVQAAFATTDECDGDEQDYLEDIRQLDTFIPELSLVAEHESGKIVGQIVLYKTSIQTRTTAIPALVLSPLSVHPDFFGRGIARLLTEKSATLAEAMGYGAVFLCGNPVMYKKLGFEPSHKYRIYHVNDAERSADWCMVLELQSGFLSEITGEVNIL